MGLSFSIPIDVAMDVVTQLRSSGKVTRGRIGVTVQEVTRELADSFGLPKVGGALISAVEKGGPAEKAGVRPSDVILKFDGKVVNSSVDLPRLVATTKPGSKVNVQLWRKGSTKDITLVIGEIQDETAVAQRGSRSGSGAAGSSESETRLGLVVSELNEQQKAELQVEGGLIVEDTKGPAARSQLQRGDVILSVGNIEIRSIAQFNEVLKKVPRGHNIALLVRRSEGTVYVSIKMDEK
jgi:serine protease Do